VAAALWSGIRNPIKKWFRRSTVTLDFVGMTLLVHNGKKFVDIYITDNMIRHRSGEFAPTRGFDSHNPHIQKPSEEINERKDANERVG
jgi:small subunit ribosomal protein S19